MALKNFNRPERNICGVIFFFHNVKLYFDKSTCNFIDQLRLDGCGAGFVYPNLVG